MQPRRELPLIIIVNPHCDIDGSAKQQILSQWQVVFAQTTQAALEILPSEDDPRLIITHVASVDALFDALGSIDDSASLNYIILLGPQSSGDVTLDDLLKKD